ncbi:MAG: lipopolysaccharide heptosyltransferase II [Candidatus Omnitrophica bacterium]|nr:lipopolysaccharide heptosyltransferase II [Candidatus Omnitrophota bacterium]MDD5436094.1 lipopolysaccharide heptosyltransferase II [Candidatus Omnitrophota bacterium]
MTKSKIQKRGGKRVLIVRLDRIGDVLLSTPVIKAVRDVCPDGHIAFMVRRYAKDILEGNPYLDEVIVYEKTGRERGFFRNLGFVRHLRRKKFDIALILHPTKRTHLLVSLAGIPETVGYNRKWGFLLTTRIPHSKQYGLKHEIDYTLDILRYTGLEPRDKTLYMPVNSHSESKVDELLRTSGIAKDDLCVAMNPGASCPSKRWKPDKFAKVADALIERYGAKIVVVAAEADKGLGDRIASLVKKDCVNLSGRTSVADVASVLRRTKLFISNDSGPVHIACAVGTPVIAIFGRHDRGLSPTRWGPTGWHDAVLHKDVGCIECLAHNCARGFKCLEAVTADEVLTAAAKILGK